MAQRGARSVSTAVSNESRRGMTPAVAKRIPDVIAQIKAAYDGLRPAERRVADVVLDEVRFAVDASNAELARRAGVSEPTVTRFCRAVGCQGVRDFKLKLAQSLVVGGALSGADAGRAQRQRHAVLGAGVQRGAAGAGTRWSGSSIPRRCAAPADVIAGARQVLVFGMGGSSSALATETQNRLFRYGVSVAAYSDPYLMRMTASTLRAGRRGDRRLGDRAHAGGDRGGGARPALRREGGLRHGAGFRAGAGLATSRSVWPSPNIPTR